MFDMVRQYENITSKQGSSKITTTITLRVFNPLATRKFDFFLSEKCVVALLL